MGVAYGLVGVASPANARTATVARVDAIAQPRGLSSPPLLHTHVQLFCSLAAHSEKYRCRLRIATRERCAAQQASTESRKMSAGPSAAAADSTRSSASSADEPLGDSPSLASLLGSTKLGDSREQIV